MCAAHGQRLQIRLVMRILTNHERRASRFLSLGLGTCDAVRFKSFGMSAGELFEIGYALADLVNAGYGSFGDAFSLRTVGASAGEVYAAGFNVVFLCVLRHGIDSDCWRARDRHHQSHRRHSSQ